MDLKRFVPGSISFNGPASRFMDITVLELRHLRVSFRGVSFFQRCLQGKRLAMKKRETEKSPVEGYTV